jgi:hypothetical protein
MTKRSHPYIFRSSLLCLTTVFAIVTCVGAAVSGTDPAGDNARLSKPAPSQTTLDATFRVATETGGGGSWLYEIPKAVQAVTTPKASTPSYTTRKSAPSSRQRAPSSRRYAPPRTRGTTSTRRRAPTASVMRNCAYCRKSCMVRYRGNRNRLPSCVRRCC